MIESISHITLLVKDLEKSAAIFTQVLGFKEVYSSDKKEFSLSKEKFFLLPGIWIALMEGVAPERTYQHIAFKIKEEDVSLYKQRLECFNLEWKEGRPRYKEEGMSLYFYDYDNHLFELHTGTLQARLAFYKTMEELSCNSQT